MRDEASSIEPSASPHARRIVEIEAARAARMRTSGAYSTLRLAALVLSLTGFAARGFGYLPEGTTAVATALAVGFVVLVVLHARVHARLRRLEAARAYHELALARLAGRFAEGPSRGARFVSEAHPYSGDLGIFGEASLFQLIDGTHTRLGETLLAGWLSAPGDGAEIVSRQDAAKDLAGRDDFREQLAVEGTLIEQDKPDPEPLLAWAASSVVRMGGLWPVALGLPIATLSLVLLSILGLAPPKIATFAVLLTYAVSFALDRRVTPVWASVGPHTSALARYTSLLRLIEAEPFASERLERLREEVKDASERIARLSTIASFFDARHNEVFRFFIGPIVLWDVHCVLLLERWRSRFGAHARRWLEVVAEVEALSSFGALAADHPDWAWPSVGSDPVFSGQGLGHPLLPPERCVTNDVVLPDAGTALLVTGSNMSGKSTLLRAMGVNAVLALAGAPACARSLEVSVVDICTSMSAKDSLERGVSFFYAEVHKIKRVLDGLLGQRPLLFLLDEILQGTNSRERFIGARTVLRHLLERGAMGAVSTHDVDLWQLGPALEPLLSKVHFEEQVANGKMTFDYRLRPGVVQTSNALALMKLVGIDLDFE
jgi:hypothetical protein